MVAPTAGRTVAVPFPFSDLSQAKLGRRGHHIGPPTDPRCGRSTAQWSTSALTNRCTPLNFSVPETDWLAQEDMASDLLTTTLGLE